MKARNGSQTAWVIGVAVLLMGAASTSVKGSQWYVATNGAAPCDGSSWVTAFTNVQAALDAAQSNDTIYLKGETFALPLNSGNGKLVWTNSWVTMVGGYAGEVGGMPGATTNTATVLLNNLSQNLASNRVMYVSNVTNGTIRNVTIRGGRVLNQHGGGLYVTGCTNLMLDAVTVEANAVRYYHSGSSFGGGLYALNSWGVITNSVFQNNGMSGTWSELRGGAMYLGGGGWRVRDCVIRNNTSSGDDSGHTCNIRGVGIYINAGTHEVKNCLLTHNCGYVNSAQGEAVYVENGTIAIKNSTVFYQPSEGIRRAGGTLTVTDSIVWNNGDDIAGTGIALQYCDIEDGDTGTACFSLNPQFERGLYLSASSSCVNTGSTTAAAAGLEGYTTRADGTTEGATTVDLGYHFKGGVAFPELYVSVNSGGDMNAGTSPGMGNAFKTVGKALAVAGDGSHINIEAGTYGTNTEVFPWTVANKYGVQLLATNAETTLVNLAGANARALTMSYCYPDAVVQNLTVANANWSAPGSNWGTPGTLGFDLYLEHVQGVVAGCTLTNSLIPRYGGGSGQSGYPAGALYGSRSDLVVSNCVVSRHTSISAYAEGYWAAGMVLNNVNGSVLNCVISTNVTRGADTAGWGFGYGSGLYVSGTGIVRNCLISGNSGTGVQNIHGQGVYVGGGTWRLENCTIVSNVLEGLYRAAGTVGVTNCILWGNGDDVFGAATLAYSDIEDGDNIGVGGCISNNPIFTTGYRLALGSPCVNTGTNLAWMQGAKDLDGYNRLRGVAVDRGAYETFIPLAITNLPVTIIDSSNAGLNGQLLSDGDAPPANAWVFWGPLDQGMTKDGWANTNALGACQVAATLTTNVFLTPPSGSYSYRYYVSNAVTEAWSDPAATFAVGVSVWLAATDPNASELGGDPGTFRVCRPPTATNDLLVVNFTVSGTAIEGVDYQALGTSVTIPVGATNAPITITPLGDRLLEGTETVTVTLASGTYIVGTPSTDSVAIGDWTPPAYACVAATGGASDYGTNWASAYTSLQFAVDNSLDGDTIYLAAGLYRLTNALTVNSKGLTIVGGYEFGAAMPGAWSADTPSILSPTGGTMRVVSVSGATNVTLRRLTISGGLQSGPIATTIYGAGITVSGSSNILFDTLVVTNNAIQASQSTVNLGGGLYALNSWGTVTNCLFRNNRLGRTYGTSSFGGGVYLQGGG